MVEYTRLLKHLMQGEDVKAVKDRLVALGYLHAATHDTFGDDTLEAGQVVPDGERSHGGRRRGAAHVGRRCLTMRNPPGRRRPAARPPAVPAHRTIRSRFPPTPARSGI